MLGRGARGHLAVRDLRPVAIGALCHRDFLRDRVQPPAGLTAGIDISLHAIRRWGVWGMGQGERMRGRRFTADRRSRPPLRPRPAFRQAQELAAGLSEARGISLRQAVGITLGVEKMAAAHADYCLRPQQAKDWD